MLVRTFMLVGTGVATMVVVAQGCLSTEPNARHCNNNDGDEYCNRELGNGQTRLYCERGTPECVSPNSEFGCVAERPADACYSPCGGRSTLAENGECLMVEDSSSGSSSEGTATEASSGSSESSTTGPVPCVSNEDCLDAAAPFCEPVSGECVACNGVEDPDGACAGADPGLPVCTGGVCVQCTAENPGACSGKTPVCDAAANACVPCTAHEQCGGAACNLFIGACLPADAVVHVGGPKPDFPTLTQAVANFSVEEEGTILVHAGIYNEAVTLDGGRVLAFLAAEIGDGITPPEWDTPAGNPVTPQLLVTAGSTVLMDGLQLSGNGSPMAPGLQNDGGRLWLDRTRVVANLGGGIMTQNNAELVLRNSQIVQNSGGGIVAQSNAELVLQNCFVGTEVSNRDTFVVSDATASVLYTTIVAGDGGLGQSRAVLCDMGAVVTIRNSLVVAIDDVPEIECSMADVSYSATETATPGTGNAALGDLMDGWLVNETDDFHLDVVPPAIGATARWTIGDPPTDIDGDPRPSADGTPDYAGADVPVAAAQPELVQ